MKFLVRNADVPPGTLPFAPVEIEAVSAREAAIEFANEHFEDDFSHYLVVQDEAGSEETWNVFPSWDARYLPGAVY